MHLDALWLAKAAYATFNFGFGAILIFLPVYFNAYFDKFQIGVLQTLPCICSMLAPPLWGAISDALEHPRVVHVVCYVSGSLLMFGVQNVSDSFAWTCVLFFLAQFQSKPAWTLLDQAVLALVAQLGAEYGKQRLYGSIGYGLGAYATGLVVTNYGIGWAFTISLGCCVPGLALLYMLPSPPPRVSSATSFAVGVRALRRRYDLMALLSFVVVTGAMGGIISAFLALDLYELSDGSAHIVGLATVCETLSELPAFYYADKLIYRLGTVNVLAMALLAYGARLAYYALMTNAWYALPFELLHGCTYGLAWAASTKYVYAEAPAGTEGFVLGLLSAVQGGVGRSLATLVGGHVYNAYGARYLWGMTSAGVPVAFLALWLFSKATTMREGICETSPLMERSA
ncbi:hypothetical protein SPRG_07414 [Saprolegnia parasitica CBS 223.65]|uniref:Major facilitator superfamily associated domain-containing protein n=1 Tax=Saprolegnia parasitica (strain CBS 223.65) TaxID=695850 RepID=A0A067CMQ9_SAPPC|nr:hypothetical protein SPRG_07414 [Saprolegnia parasitica CBS 223.65]KDO27816.1 hypothetical protein SPRG_07414 [Saprolegnia parasitica CBS 223.65]|eukprot:XP_012201590.1 hypothetical protein SPRG_07414 [Saprolegnia parasitica CBS 223.65]